MDRVQKTINTDLQSVSPKMMIVQGVVQNLPEILGAIKEIYRINKKGEAFSQVLRSQLDELNISKENFNVLVISLTELSNVRGRGKWRMKAEKNGGAVDMWVTRSAAAGYPHDAQPRR